MDKIEVDREDLRLLLELGASCHDGEGMCCDPNHNGALGLVTKYGFKDELLCVCGHMLSHHEDNPNNFPRVTRSHIGAALDRGAFGKPPYHRECDKKLVANDELWSNDGQLCYDCNEHFHRGKWGKNPYHCTREYAEARNRAQYERCGKTLDPPQSSD